MEEPEEVEWGFRLANLGRGNRRRTIQTSDPETLGSAWCGRINQIPDAVGTPEELLMAKQTPEQDEPREEIGFGVFVSRLGPFISRLPQPEREAITLVWLQERTQSDAAEILGVTQPTIVYRLQRGLERLKFWVQLPAWTEQDVHRAIVLSLPEIESKVAASFWRTTCITETAMEFRIHRLQAMRIVDCVIEKLRAMHGLEQYGEALAKVREAGGMSSSKRKMWEK